MRLHLRRVLAGLATALIATTGIGFVAQPAQAGARAIYTCPYPTATELLNVCLYNSTMMHTTTGYWRRSWGEVGNGCQNLSLHRWTTGGAVNDAASSLAVSLRSDAETFRVRFYQWTNCSSANGYFDVLLSGSGVTAKAFPDLFPLETNWNNEIGSVQLFVA